MIITVPLWVMLHSYGYRMVLVDEVKFQLVQVNVMPSLLYLVWQWQWLKIVAREQLRAREISGLRRRNAIWSSLCLYHYVFFFEKNVPSYKHLIA